MFLEKCWLLLCDKRTTTLHRRWITLGNNLWIFLFCQNFDLSSIVYLLCRQQHDNRCFLDKWIKMKPVFQMKTFYDNRHERPRWRQMPVHDSWLTVNIVIDPTEKRLTMRWDKNVPRKAKWESVFSFSSSISVWNVRLKACREHFLREQFGMNWANMWQHFVFMVRREREKKR